MRVKVSLGVLCYSSSLVSEKLTLERGYSVPPPPPVLSLGGGEGLEFWVLGEGQDIFDFRGLSYERRVYFLGRQGSHAS